MMPDATAFTHSQVWCPAIEFDHPLQSIGDVWNHLSLAALPIFGLAIISGSISTIFNETVKQIVSPLAKILASSVLKIRFLPKKLSVLSKSSLDTSAEGPPFSWISALIYSYLVYALLIFIMALGKTHQQMSAITQMVSFAFINIPLLMFAVLALQNRFYPLGFLKRGVLAKVFFVDMVFLFVYIFAIFGLYIEKYILAYPIFYIHELSKQVL